MPLEEHARDDEYLPVAISEGGKWLRWHYKTMRSTNRFFYRFGKWTATHSLWTIGIVAVFAEVCCFGFLNFKVLSDATKLWAPANSLTKEHEDIVLSYFDDESDFATLLLASPEDVGNVLTKEVFDALWELDVKIKAIETENGNAYASLCTVEADGSTCEQRGVTLFWGNNVATYKATVANDDDILQAINVTTYPNGETVNLEAVFGNSITFDNAGDVVSAEAMVQTYTVMSSADNADVNEESNAWLLRFEEVIADEVDNYTDKFVLRYLTGRSIDDAFEDSAARDMAVFVASYVLMAVFVMFTAGRFCGAGPVRRRTWLGLSGMATALAAVAAAYGANSGLKVPFTPLSAALPIILLGIGVDGMFVILASFDNTDETLAAEERVALALKRCGVSVTYASLVNFLAVMLGGMISLPAVRNFCLYAGTAIFFSYAFQMTAFVALLSLDACRQKAGRVDWCCCFTNKAYLKAEPGVKVYRNASMSLDEDEGKNNHEPAVVVKVSPAEVHLKGAFGRWMREVYTPIVISATGKCLVIVATTALLVVGVFGAMQMTRGFDVMDLIPDDHYARDYKELASDYELDVETQHVPMGVYTRAVDYPDGDVQAQVMETNALMLDLEFMTGPIDSWLSSFVAWAASDNDYSENVGTSGGFSVYQDRATFYEALSAFTTDGDNVRFTDDIIYTSDNATIEISRSFLYLIDLEVGDNTVDALEDARSVVEQSVLDPQPFEYSPVFHFAEQDLVIYRALIIAFIFAIAVVSVFSLFMLGQGVIVILLSLTVVMINIELLGFVQIWGLDINGATVIARIIAVGLMVDYTVHIVYLFLYQNPITGKDQRIAAALGEIGPAVVAGSATMLLGILPLAFASYAIFRAFFKIFLLAVLFALFHGIAFIPVALSLLPDSLVAAHPVAAASVGVKGVTSITASPPAPQAPRR